MSLFLPFFSAIILIYLFTQRAGDMTEPQWTGADSEKMRRQHQAVQTNVQPSKQNTPFDGDSSYFSSTVPLFLTEKLKWLL